MTEACIVCGSKDWEPLYGVLLRCTCCSFVRAKTIVSDEEARSIYSKHYFHGNEYADYLADAAVHRTNFAQRYKEMRSISGSIGSLFEIGCAYGLWLAYASGQGLSVAGIDVCPEAVEYARRELGQQVYAGDFLDLKLAAGQYEAFCMWDTIEHLVSPDRYVERISSLLRRGGWLFLTTGNIASPYAKWRGRRWRMIHPPSHLSYFSRRTIAQFLQARGFDVVTARHIPMYRTLHSVTANMKVIGRGLPRLFAAGISAMVPRAVQSRVGAWVDLGDIMLVAARKEA